MNGNGAMVGPTARRSALTRFWLLMKRTLKLNRFLLVIDTKKGVSISAMTVIIVDLIDLLWNLSMTFGPLNSTMISLLLLETLLVICVSSVLLYAIRTDNKAELRSILFIWLVVVAIDYALRTTIIVSALVISEKASTSAKVMKCVFSAVMLVLVAHCWQCVFTYYDDNNGQMTTVRITPSDDRGRTLAGKRPMMLMRHGLVGANQSGQHQHGQQGELALSAGDLATAGQSHHSMLGFKGPTGGVAHSEAMANMLRAPSEDAVKSRW